MISTINQLDSLRVKNALVANMNLDSLEYENKNGAEALEALVTPGLLDSIKRDNFNIPTTHFLLRHNLYPTRQRIQVLKVMLIVIKNCRDKYSFEEANYMDVFKHLGLGRN